VIDLLPVVGNELKRQTNQVRCANPTPPMFLNVIAHIEDIARVANAKKHSKYSTLFSEETSSHFEHWLKFGGNVCEYRYIVSSRR
jgi:hypothetical protein